MTKLTLYLQKNTTVYAEKCKSTEVLKNKRRIRMDIYGCCKNYVDENEYFEKFAIFIIDDVSVIL